MNYLETIQQEIEKVKGIVAQAEKEFNEAKTAFVIAEKSDPPKTKEELSNLEKNRDRAFERLRIEKERLAIFESKLLPALAPSPRKTLSKVAPNNATGFPLFVSEEFRQEKRVKFDECQSRGIYILSTRLFGDSNTPFKVYMRDCYKTIRERVLELIPSHNILIAGTQGIGKSTMGLLIAFDFADRGDIVIYLHKTKGSEF